MDFAAIQSQLAGICTYAGSDVTFTVWAGEDLETPRTVKAIFSAPRHDTRIGETALDTEYPTITAPTETLSGVIRGDLCSINGTDYSVIRMIPDGYQTTKAYLAYE